MELLKRGNLNSKLNFKLCAVLYNNNVTDKERIAVPTYIYFISYNVYKRVANSLEIIPRCLFQ